MRGTELVLAIAVVGILAMMIVPVPALLLDMMLTTNISVSLLTLFVSMYILKPVEFSVFPSLLLVLTLFRRGEYGIQSCEPQPFIQGEHHQLSLACR